MSVVTIENIIQLQLPVKPQYLSVWLKNIFIGFYVIINYLIGFVFAWGIFLPLTKINIIGIHSNLFYPIKKTLTIHYVFNDLYYIALDLYTTYSSLFLLIGFILLVSIIGVIILGLKKALYVKRQNISGQFFRYR